jgi:hypothetical protein
MPLGGFDEGSVPEKARICEVVCGRCLWRLVFEVAIYWLSGHPMVADKVRPDGYGCAGRQSECRVPYKWGHPQFFWRRGSNWALSKLGGRVDLHRFRLGDHVGRPSFRKNCHSCLGSGDADRGYAPRGPCRALYRCDDGPVPRHGTCALQPPSGGTILPSPRGVCGSLYATVRSHEEARRPVQEPLPLQKTP